MKYVNKNIISAVDSASVNGSAIDASQLVAASFHIRFGDAHAAGTLKLQASNDINVSGQSNNNSFIPTNWVDIPSQTATITSGTSALLSIPNVIYRYIRPVYTNSATWVQSQTVTAVADVAGSLNNTYFTLSGMNALGVNVNFYVWFDNGTGVDPALPGKTGIPITYTDNATANTLGGLIRTALALQTSYFVITGANAAAIITQVNAGVPTAAVDGAVPTGFTFGAVSGGFVPTTINVDLFGISI